MASAWFSRPHIFKHVSTLYTKSKLAIPVFKTMKLLTMPLSLPKEPLAVDVVWQRIIVPRGQWSREDVYPSVGNNHCYKMCQ